jgi:protein-S-isoprenylcysteine O-methyltransferase Ste14
MLGLVLAVFFTVAWIPLFLYRAEAVQEALPYYSGAERRWVMLSPVIIAVHMTLGCILISVSEPPLWRAAAGTALFVAAVAFWFWGRRQIGPLGVTRLPDEPPREFRRDGAFGVVRHPMFFAYLMTAVALAIVAARPLLWGTLAAVGAVLAVRALQE